MLIALRILFVISAAFAMIACAPQKAFAAVTCNDRGCSDWNAAAPSSKRVAKIDKPRQVTHRRGRTITTYARRPQRGVSMAGVVAPLAAKAAEIQSACGSVVISAIRPGASVRGSGRPSLHRTGHAIDMQGNPRCIYAHLQGWPGGYSVDYGRVSHVHISYSPDGREWGARFAHWRPTRRVRLAHAR